MFLSYPSKMCRLVFNSQQPLDSKVSQAGGGAQNQMLMVMESLKTLENTVQFSQASVTYSYSDYFLRRGLENYRWVGGWEGGYGESHYLAQAGLETSRCSPDWLQSLHDPAAGIIGICSYAWLRQILVVLLQLVFWGYTIVHKISLKLEYTLHQADPNQPENMKLCSINPFMAPRMVARECPSSWGAISVQGSAVAGLPTGPTS